MDPIDFGYSLKNVPLPSKNCYIYKLIDKTEKLIKRMRWKAYFFDKDQNNENKNDDIHTIFKSRKCPPKIPDLAEFEDEMINLIESIQFRTSSNEFLRTLELDRKRINSSNKVFVAADKTQNFYELDKEQYNKILHDNITKNYKKDTKNLPKTITNEAKKIAKKFKVHDKVDTMAKRQCFFTIKDHKSDFRTNPKYRLLNPTKSELGKLSQNILKNLNNEIRKKMNLNQWKNSSDVINWYKNLQDKKHYTFTVFDIEEFYPSISEELLNKAF